jgi:hypothetical protein
MQQDKNIGPNGIDSLLQNNEHIPGKSLGTFLLGIEVRMENGRSKNKK